MKLQHIHCRCCGAKLSSGRIFYPQGDEYICQFCKPPVLKSEAPPELYVSTDEFTGFVPVRYPERVDVT